VVLAGNGPLRDRLRGAPSNVRWVGSVDARAMRRLYEAVDMVLLPSRGEGLPLVVQEAMSCGLPVVISDDEVYAGALREADVCVTTARSAPALLAAMDHAFTNRDAIGRSARQYAQTHWTLSAMIAGYEEVLSRFLPDGAIS
jgi:glycosyltransferase involved in cell wall biosynthesis